MTRALISKVEMSNRRARRAAASTKKKPRIPTTAKERLISRAETLDRVALSFPTVWKLMRQGKFPRSKLVGGRVMWLESEIDAYIAALPNQRYKGDPAPRAGKAVA